MKALSPLLLLAGTVMLGLLTGVQVTVAQPVVVVDHEPGQVRFQNTETQKAPGVSSHLVTNLDGTLLVGTQFKAELYYLNTDTGNLSPLAATVSSFRLSTTSVPGTWNGTALIAVPV